MWFCDETMDKTFNASLGDQIILDLKDKITVGIVQ